MNFGPPGSTPATGWKVTHDRYYPAGQTVYNARGQAIFKGRTPCRWPVEWLTCSNRATWEVELTAPPQGTWKTLFGSVLMDARDGTVWSSSAGIEP